MKKYISAAILLSLTSCSAFYDAEFKDLHELASANSRIVVPVEGGTAEFTVYSNGKVTVDAEGAEACSASLDATSFSGDHKLTVEFPRNDGMRRMVRLCLSLDGGVKKDTLYALQEGEQAYLRCPSPYKIVDGSAAGMAGFDIETNIGLDELETEINYITGSQGWISAVTPDLSGIIVETTAAEDEAARGSVTLHYTDGWGESHDVALFVTRTDKNGKYGHQLSFAEVAAYAGRGEIADEVYTEAVVISDCSSANMELNPSISYNKVDTDENSRTAYVQALDASSGFRLKFVNPSDNLLVHGTVVSLSLYGTTVEKDERTESYTIYGLSGANLLDSRSGTSVTPNRKKVSELSDKDIYTYVTVPDMEFACKWGAYTNVYENYTLKSSVNESATKNNNRLDGWATLLHDADGHAIYAPVNMLCLWRRSGEGVPQGIGPLTGIVVSNDIRRYGNVGRYQIRVLDESGFGQEKDGKGAFTTLAEWDGAPYQYRFSQYAANPRYAYAKLASIVPSDDFSSSNTTPRGELRCENSQMGSDTTYPLSSFTSYTSPSAENLGACPTSPASLYRKALCLSTEIKGWFEWQDNEVCGYKGLVMDINTEGISGSLVQVHYAFSVGKVSAASSQHFPAHWCTEYSCDGGATWTLVKDAATGSDYVHLRTLPWWDTTIGGVNYRTNSYCGLGCTEHLAYLPAEALAGSLLKLRIRPYDDVMTVFPSEWDGEVETARVRHNTNEKATTISFDFIHVSYK